MRQGTVLGMAAAVATGVLVIGDGKVTGPGAVALAKTEAGYHCTNATIRGTFGTQMQGRTPIPPPFGSGIQDVIGVVVRTYDGEGSFTQVDNIKGSVSGIVPDRPGAGTYQVNPDCSGVAVFDPGSGITIEERLVVVHRGNEIRAITSSPPPFFVTAVHLRIDRR